MAPGTSDRFTCTNKGLPPIASKSSDQTPRSNPGSPVLTTMTLTFASIASARTAIEDTSAWPHALSLASSRSTTSAPEWAAARPGRAAGIPRRALLNLIEREVDRIKVVRRGRVMTCPARSVGTSRLAQR
jgi:hypothetical protein